MQLLLITFLNDKLYLYLKVIEDYSLHISIYDHWKNQSVIKYHNKRKDNFKHLFGCRPFWLQLIFVEAFLQHPAQAGHTLHPVEQGRVLCCVLIALINTTYRGVLSST